MALTVAGLETEVIGRISGRMDYVGFPIVATGSNAALQGPIRRAVRFLGIEPADPLTVVDADVSAIVGWQVELLADLATLQALKAILGQLTDFDAMIGTDQERYSQVEVQVRAQIKDLESVVAKPYGPSVPNASTGRMVQHEHLRGGSPALHEPHRHHGGPVIYGINVY